MITLTACLVERNEAQDYHILWRSAHPGQRVRVYMSQDAEQFYNGGKPHSPVAESDGESVVVPNPNRGVRHFFLLEFERDDDVVLAERKLTLQGTSNFRDLGGYESADGRRLKWGRLYRSSKLSALTASDIEYVRRLGVTLICDFRQVVERDLEPSLLGENPTHTTAHLPVMPGSSQSFLDSLHNGVIELENSEAFMTALNRELVATQMPSYAEMFELLMAQEHTLLIHCASGKDRTGFGAALLLDVLGVDEEEIVDDYLLTNACLPLNEELERLSSQVTDGRGGAVGHDVLRPLLEVRPEYILACFEEIQLRYGSKRQFYESALGLDEDKIAWLRNSYLH